MAHGSRLVDLVHARIEDFLAERTSILRSISPDLEPLDAFSRRFLSGGKRFRALFCYWGWEAVRRAGLRPVRGGGRTRPIPSRLGRSRARDLPRRRARARRHHRQLRHPQGRPVGPPAVRGAARRIGLGRQQRATSVAPRRSCSATCCSGGATSCSTRGSRRSPTGRRPATARAEFIRMRTEVTVGQYLDILEERAWRRAVRRGAAHPRRTRDRLQVGEVHGRVAARDRRRHRRRDRRRSSTRCAGSACRSASPTSCATTCSASTATPRSPASRAATTCARASAPCSSRSRASDSPPDSAACSTSSSAIPTSAPSRSRCCSARSPTAAPSTRSSALIADNVARATAVLADAPFSRDAQAELGALAKAVTRRSS